MRSWRLIKKFENKWKGISNAEFKNTKITKEYPKNVEQRYVSFPVPGNLDILNEKVLITVWRSRPLGILIHSSELAESFIQYFNSVWNQSKK